MENKVIFSKSRHNFLQT